MGIAFLLLFIFEVVIITISWLYYRKLRDLDDLTDHERYIVNGQMVAWFILMFIVPVFFFGPVFGLDNYLILGLDFFPVLLVIICLPFFVYLLVNVTKNQICPLFITSFMKIEVLIVRGGWAIVIEILMMVGLALMLSLWIFS